MPTFIERHADKIRGVLSCFDRVVLTGTLPDLCHADAMARFLGARQIRLFDYPRFAEPFREELRTRAERLAAEHGLTIDFIRRRTFRKEDRIKTILARRGDHPGLVHIFSAMEPCPSFKPWHDKRSGKTVLRSTEAKCLHYYFYFLDRDLGLCYLRVPTWAPFRLQFYCNGHSVLARALAKRGIAAPLLDKAFVEIADWTRAQALADAWDPHRLHRQLDRIAATYCLALRHFPAGVHWSCMQVEYATDVVFHRQAAFRPIYEALTHTAIHAVKPAHVATFLGRKLTGQYQGEVGNDFSTQIQGARIKHTMGWAAIKLYDKFGLIARVECTANDVTFFQHHRMVEHRDGTQEFKLAPVRKSIYSLPVLRAPEKTPPPSTRGSAATAASICSTAPTWICFAPSSAASSPSAASRHGSSGPTYPNAPAPSSRGFSSASGPMVSSRRSASGTSTTSRPSVAPSPRRPSSCENL
ncbi:MAG: MarR family transcriptional regulator [candidate division NC10 bacterium]